MNEKLKKIEEAGKRNIDDDIKNVEKASSGELLSMVQDHMEFVDASSLNKNEIEKITELAKKIVSLPEVSSITKDIADDWLEKQSNKSGKTKKEKNMTDKTLARTSSNTEKLSELANQKKNKSTRILAILNKNIPIETLKEIADKEGTKTEAGRLASYLYNASSETVKQKDLVDIYNKAINLPKEQKEAILVKLSKNEKTPTTILEKIVDKTTSDEVKTAAKKEMGRRSGNPFEQENDEDVSGYSAELSLNKIVGRLHDVAIEAIANKYRGFWSGVKSFFGGASAQVVNTGMSPLITKKGEASTFKGVSNTKEYSIIVFPTGLFARKKAVIDALKLYLKYFTGQDVDIAENDIARKGTDLRGRETNIWVYNYRITYKIYKDNTDFETLLGESLKVIPVDKSEKNVWITENINPFNHSEPIAENKSSPEKIVKMIEKGENVQAKRELKKLLQEKIRGRFKKVLETQNP